MSVFASIPLNLFIMFSSLPTLHSLLLVSLQAKLSKGLLITLPYVTLCKIPNMVVSRRETVYRPSDYRIAINYCHYYNLSIKHNNVALFDTVASQWRTSVMHSGAQGDEQLSARNDHA